MFPTVLKIAQVLPLLQKLGLDRSVPVNYRPMSNPNAISKIVERLVLARLMPPLFLASGNFNPHVTGQSTETALLRILDSLYKSIVLDLSAAFDTIGHSILLGRISDEFGVSGAPLAAVVPHRSSPIRQARPSPLVDCSMHGWSSTRLRPRPDFVHGLHITCRSAHHQPRRCRLCAAGHAGIDYSCKSVDA